MRLVIFTLLLAVISNGCSKSSSLTDQISGRWQLTDQQFGLGGPGTWMPVDQSKPEFILFGFGQRFSSISAQSGTLSYNYHFLDDSTIVFKNNSLELKMYVSRRGDELLTGLYGCSENCLRKYKLVSAF